MTKLIAANPDAIYSPTYGKEGGLILKQTKELGYNKSVFGSDVWSSPELITSAGDAAEGVRLVKPAIFQGADYKTFRDFFYAKYNEEPDIYAGYSYDIAMILAKAYNESYNSNLNLRDYLLTMPLYYGATGETKFDGNGDCNTKPFERQQIMDGKYNSINK